MRRKGASNPVEAVGLGAEAERRRGPTRVLRCVAAVGEYAGEELATEGRREPRRGRGVGCRSGAEAGPDAKWCSGGRGRDRTCYLIDVNDAL